MQKNMFTRLVIVSLIMTLSISGISFSQEKLRKEGRYYLADIEKTFDVQKGGDLVMEKIRGDVAITTWDKNIVKIHEVRKMDVYTEAEAKAVLKEIDIIYRQAGNKITVGGADSYRSYMSSTFEIVVPVEFNVNIGTSGGDLSVADLKGTVNLSTSGGDIDLVRLDGRVIAKTSGGDIAVKENKQQVSVKTSGGDIEIYDVMGEVEARTSGGDIRVKNNKARVSVKTSGGDIELSNIGAEIEASTSGGDIKVEGADGKLSVITSGGDIELKNIKEIVRARTSGGDIVATHVLNGIDAKTSGGDIDLDDIQGFIEAKTTGGDVKARMTLTDFSKDHHVTMSSTGGDLTLYIPEKLPATISAVINKRSTSREYTIYSDFPLTSKKETDEDSRRHRDEIIRKEGKINGGGDLIQLETTNGNIAIKKLK